MKVKVNEDACIGCGACTAIAPDVFELNDEGLSTVTCDTVSDENTEATKEAVEACPIGAIEEM